jgi:hypothetical protein
MCSNTYPKTPHTVYLLSLRFTGNQIKLETEIARLQSTFVNITATDAAAATATPAASDKGGRLLRMIVEWRQQRKAAIEREVSRLQQRLAVVTGKEQQQEVSAEDRLVEWIKENGGQVGLVFEVPSLNNIPPHNNRSTPWERMDGMNEQDHPVWITWVALKCNGCSNLCCCGCCSNRA